MTTTPISRWANVITALPVIASLALFGLAEPRWPLALAYALAAAALGWRARDMTASRTRLTLAIVLGVASGVLGLALGAPAAGPIPGATLSVLTGALAAAAVYCVATRNGTYAWTYAWLLAILCLYAGMPVAAMAALGVLIVVTLLAAFATGRVAAAGATAVAGFGVFVLLSGVFTWQLATTLVSSEEWLSEALYRLMQNPALDLLVGAEARVALTRHSRVSLNERVVFEIDEGGDDYLRQTVFDELQADGLEWRSRASTTAPARPVGGDAGRPLELWWLGPATMRVPTPAGTIAVTGDGLAARHQRGDVWTLDEPVTGIAISLLVTSAADRDAGEGAATTAAADLRQRLQPLARSVVGAAKTARQKADALAAYFQAEFTYSLETHLGGEGHPLEVLLRERRPAYCVYFAAAMALLLEATDVQARLVGGFLASEHNRLTGLRTVRRRDAHAWVEAYLPDEGRWVAFDPTPSTSRAVALGLEPATLLDAAVDASAAWLRRQWAAFVHAPGAYLANLAARPWVWGPALAWALWRLWPRGRGAGSRRAARAAVEAADPRLRALGRRFRYLAAKLAGRPLSDALVDREILAAIFASVGAAAANVARDFLCDYERARYRGESARCDELELRLVALAAHTRRASPTAAPGERSV